MRSEHTVLVVDDDADIRDALLDLLGSEGYAAVGMSNGQEALDWLRNQGKPCVILLDWMMPVMDGETFLLEQERDPAIAQIPVVIITASGNTRLTGLKGRPLVRKPIEVEKLMGAVQSHC